MGFFFFQMNSEKLESNQISLLCSDLSAETKIFQRKSDSHAFAEPKEPSNSLIIMSFLSIFDIHFETDIQVLTTEGIQQTIYTEGLKLEKNAITPIKSSILEF